MAWTRVNQPDPKHLAVISQAVQDKSGQNIVRSRCEVLGAASDSESRAPTRARALLAAAGWDPLKPPPKTTPTLP
eukprot:80898-Pleurochrysis_carterae.AAC.1